MIESCKKRRNVFRSNVLRDEVKVVYEMEGEDKGQEYKGRRVMTVLLTES